MGVYFSGRDGWKGLSTVVNRVSRLMVDGKDHLQGPWGGRNWHGYRLFGFLRMWMDMLEPSWVCYKSCRTDVGDLVEG